MSNFLHIPFHEADPELQQFYQEVAVSMGERNFPNWLTHMGAMPNVARGCWGLLKSIIVEGQLSPLLQDLILFTVAYHRTVPYCMALHGSNLIRMTGTLTFTELHEIAQGKSHGFIPPKYQTAINVASKLATTQCSLSESDFKCLLQAGFNHVEAQEITLLVSVGLFFNTYTFAADLPVDEKIAKQMATAH